MACSYTAGASGRVGIREELSILRCRRCRRCVLDSTCLLSGLDDLMAECTVWHVDHDASPDWILTVIDQVHWTVGKLNCQHCGARLGGFNFLNRSKCPCGRDTSVHLSKSRVDLGFKRPVHPSRPGVAAGRAECKDKVLRAPADENFPQTQATRCSNPPLLPHAPHIPTDEELQLLRTAAPQELGEEPRSHASVAEHNGPEPTGRLENVESGLRASPRRTGTQEQEPQSEFSSGSVLTMTKREKNRMKSLRRKQRKKERWMQRQLEEKEQDEDGNLTGSDDDQKEGYTCAVCLDVYYKPYMCQPCSHVFCEPCLRTLAKNRSDRTPCPLCRTLVSHVLFQEELHRRVSTYFPRDYRSRKKTFQNANYSKWPLPNCPKHLHMLWGLHRPGASAGRWQLAFRAWILEGLDVGRWLDWIITVIIVSWVLLYIIM
ncbi:E3 ubiquitin-protein ligase RNF180 [Trichomycterus rosablanca]|uniref:E3 ubiquitin-protein ligase RNF180 n=1 Tax=Trichomycterus rosablanca TaxID=2290929 RepID=UPI002F360BE0